VRTTATIGVAIATRDRPGQLARCLESLQAGQLIPAEVVIADQSAGPATREVVAAAQSPEVALRYVDGGGHGLAGAQNAAFRHSSTPVVAVIDDDCVADPAWLAVLEQRFTADAGLALVAGRVLPQAPVGDRLHAVASRTSDRRAAFSGRIQPWLLGSGNNFALRREWFARVGGCDVRLGPGTPGLGALDMDLFYRVLRAGGPGLYEPAATVYHERATRAGRRQRRWPYGHGLGAMCLLRIREGDLYGLRLLAAWLGLRARLIVSAVARGGWDTIQEEALVLGGTVAGMAHALTLSRPHRDGARRIARGDD
jgi:GT2 family glycosyltransferase